MLSSASSAKFPLSFGSASSVSSENVSIVPGNDTIASNCLTFPCASLDARSKDSIAVSIMLLRSKIGTPQPQTYYTDLVRIENSGNASHEVDSVFVQLTSGASSLGALTVFYCSAVPKDPYDDSDCASFTLNDTNNSGTLIGRNVFPASLDPGMAGYIGAAGFANSAAKVSAQISFQIRINSS